MTARLHNADVDLGGLLEVLGRNLYSRPEVAVRELVQNAHDSLTRRAIEDGSLPPGASIRVQPRPAEGQLRIEDDGAGLTRDEIVEYLAVVGRGYTGVLRDQSGSEQLIGAFGLGFLSAYVIADRVEVWTCSRQDPDRAWRFVSADGQRYSVEPAASRPVGTEVRLTLKEKHREYCSAGPIRRLLDTYCPLLSHPIHVDGDPDPVTIVPPWRLDEAPSTIRLRKLRLEFAERFDQWLEPVATLPVDAPECRGLL